MVATPDLEVHADEETEVVPERPCEVIKQSKPTGMPAVLAELLDLVQSHECPNPATWAATFNCAAGHRHRILTCDEDHDLILSGKVLIEMGHGSVTHWERL